MRVGVRYHISIGICNIRIFHYVARKKICIKATELFQFSKYIWKQYSKEIYLETRHYVTPAVNVIKYELIVQ